MIKALGLCFALTVAVGGPGVSNAQVAAADVTGPSAAAAVPKTAATPPATSAIAGHARALGLTGAPNFRDIGGYTTATGRHVRWGEVYRSSELSNLTPADAAQVDALHVVAVVDLRTEEERSRAASVWTHLPADIYVSPKVSLAPVMHTILADAATPDGARAGLVKFYAQMPDDYRTEYAALFHRIAAGDLPMVVHCTAGKDRTGVAVALLLTAVGVPRQTVVADYALTEQLVPPAAAAARRAVPVGGGDQATPSPSQGAEGQAPQAQAGKVQAALAQLPEESRRALWRSDPEYIEAALDSMQHEYGSIDGYLERGLGLSKPEIQALRKSLLD